MGGPPTKRGTERMTNNRAAVAAAFVAGAMLVTVAVVIMGGPTPEAELSLAQKKAMLKASVIQHQNMAHGPPQEVLEQLLAMSDPARFESLALKMVDFGGTDISTSKSAAGNDGVDWNFGQNFGGLNEHAVNRGWKSGADTIHSATDATGGMYGKWGTDEEPQQGFCGRECSDPATAHDGCCDHAYGDNQKTYNDYYASKGYTWRTNIVDNCKNYDYWKWDWFECSCAWTTHGNNDKVWWEQTAEEREQRYAHYSKCRSEGGAHNNAK